MISLLTCLLVACSQPECEHQWSKPTCTSAGVCSICGEEKDETVDHDWIPADCVTPKHCKKCTLTVGSATGHNYGADQKCESCGETNPLYVQRFTYKLNSDATGYVLYSCGNYQGDTAVIPATHNGKPVMGIFQGAFKGMSTLKSVVIGECVQSIGPSAFENCVNLIDVEMSKDSQLRTIYEKAFASCKKLQEITLPDNLISSGYEVFANCSSLKKVTIGASVISIAENTFSSCKLLQTVEFNGTTQQLEQNFDGKVKFLPRAIKYIKCNDGIYTI